MSDSSQYDVAIVGASLAGCAVAMLFGRRGMKVALIERDSQLSGFKKVCTHLIQSSATPTIERLGLAAPIEAAGGVRQELEISTPWGWIRDTVKPSDRSAYGYNLRREKLDPMLREIAAKTPGVDFMPGHSVKELIIEDGRAVGVKTVSSPEPGRSVRARLVVAADGSHSQVADLAGNKATITPHGRFTYSAYYSDLPMPEASTSLIYFLNPNWASALRTDDGLTMLGAMPTMETLADWKDDIEGEFLKYFDAIPGAPSPRDGNRVGPFLGMIKMPNISRSTTHAGIAFIGDAAFTSDPLWGGGCGFALQTAEWLVDSVGEALGGGGDLDSSLKLYARHHKKMLAGHKFVMTDYATGRRFNAIETLMNSAGARDPVCAAHVVAFGSRNTTLKQFLAPRAVARAIWVSAKHSMRGAEPENRPEGPQVYKARLVTADKLDNPAE
jgi:flavin-dependent dehydrogenase